MNQTDIPNIGFGTASTLKGNGDSNPADCIAYAIKHGYRFIDTAWVYGTENLVGDAIKMGGGRS